MSRLPEESIDDTPAFARVDSESPLHVRVGTHAEFLDRMRRRLNTQQLADQPPGLERPLSRLTSRDTSDPTIALLDAWAITCDVLTFYQERIANEGYLKTARQSFSVQQLARAIDYELDPGVAAQVLLEFTVNEDEEGVGWFIIAAGTQVQSVPGQDEEPQIFETTNKAVVRAEWNELRLSPGATIDAVDDAENQIAAAEFPDWRIENGELMVVGRQPRIKPGDWLLAVDQPAKSEEGPPTANEQRDAEALWAVIMIDQASYDPDHDATTLVWKPAGLVASARYGELESFAGFKNPVLFHFRQRVSLFGHNAAPWKGVSNEVKARLYPRAAVAHWQAPVGSSEPPKAQTPWKKLLCEGLPPVDIRGLAAKQNDQKIQLYAATARGVYLATCVADELRPNTPLSWKRISSSLANEDVHCCAIDETGALYVGTSQGIVYYSEDEGSTWQAVPPVLTKHSFEVTVAASTGETSQKTEPRSVDIPLGSSPVTAIQVETDSTDVCILSLSIIRPEGRFVATAQSHDFKESRRKLGVWTPATETQSWEPHISHAGAGHWFSGLRFGGFGPDGPLDEWPGWQLVATETPEGAAELKVELDAKLPGLLPDSWAVLLDQSGGEGQLRCQPLRIGRVAVLRKSDFELSGDVTQVVASAAGASTKFSSFDRRQTRVLTDVQSLEIHRAEPERKTVASNTDSPASHVLNLGRSIKELKAGKRVVVRGRLRGSALNAPERCEISEIESVTDDTIRLRGLSFNYDPASVRINANLVEATHGETVADEVLGSGEVTVTFQRFVLRQSPLTYVRDEVTRQLRSTLQVRVNDAVWEEVPRLYGQPPNRRCYMVRLDDSGQAHVIFGDGQHGSCLPTGLENVTARYRYGIGADGMVREGQLSLLPAAPLGIDSVTNPKPAWGARNAETSDSAREQAPRRLSQRQGVISLKDYEAFALAFAGICKVRATRRTIGQRATVRLDIAGQLQVAANTSSGTLASSALCDQLESALRLEQPHQDVIVRSSIVRRFGVSAALDINVNSHRSEKVLADAQQRLARKFSWAQREFGQDVDVCELVHTLQQTPGVIAVHSLQQHSLSETSNAAAAKEEDREQLMLIDPAKITLREVGA